LKGRLHGLPIRKAGVFFDAPALERIALGAPQQPRVPTAQLAGVFANAHRSSDLGDCAGEGRALLSYECVEVSNGDHRSAADPHARQLAHAKNAPDGLCADT
jgi:hypothetical protein